MRVLHLNIHAFGGSYEYAALLSAALAEQGIESRVLSKNSQGGRTRQGFVRSCYSPSVCFLVHSAVARNKASVVSAGTRGAERSGCGAPSHSGRLV